MGWAVTESFFKLYFLCLFRIIPWAPTQDMEAASEIDFDPTEEFFEVGTGPEFLASKLQMIKFINYDSFLCCSPMFFLE